MKESNSDLCDIQQNMRSTVQGMRLRQQRVTPFSFLPTFYAVLICCVLLFFSTMVKCLKPDFKTNHYFNAGLGGHLSKPVEVRQVVITPHICFLLSP